MKQQTLLISVLIFGALYCSFNVYFQKLLGQQLQKVLFTILNVVGFTLIYLGLGMIMEDNQLQIPKWYHDLNLRCPSILVLCSIYYFLNKSFHKSQIQTTCLIAVTFMVYLFYVTHSLILICEGFILIRLFLFSIDSISAEKFRSFQDFLNYIFFLPALTSGPLVTPAAFYSALAKTRKITSYRVTRGITLMILGAFRIFIVSSMLNVVYGNYYQYFANSFQIASLIIACSAFYLMFYFSFSGVIDISRGFASINGFYLPVNFRSPVGSKNLQEHWLRWHITFFQLLRQYVFLPTVVALQSRGWIHFHLKIIIGIFSVFFALALWQGANMSYFVFSTWHAFGLSIVYLYGIVKKNYQTRGNAIFQSRVYRIASWSLTFFYISFGYFFLMADFSTQKTLLQMMVYGN